MVAQIRVNITFRFIANISGSGTNGPKRSKIRRINLLFHVILYQPEIPPNTGNIIRLCANSGASLHLIKPLGFELDDKKVRRAGLDYHEMASVRQYRDWDAFRQQHPDMTIWSFSSKASKQYDLARFEDNHGLLFGPETRGLPKQITAKLGAENNLRLPMRQSSRSLNLSNTVAIALYEALRQTGWQDLS
jgi:tRNA (cytidine/uridine-2'-O-)-methyltransferase